MTRWGYGLGRRCGKCIYRKLRTGCTNPSAPLAFHSPAQLYGPAGVKGEHTGCAFFQARLEYKSETEDWDYYDKKEGR